MVSKIIRFVVGLTVLVVVSGSFWWGLQQWHGQDSDASSDSEKEDSKPVVDGTMPVRISAEARKNLGVFSESLRPVTYWSKIEIPGVVTDRPGISDRGVVAPITGVVTAIHAYPGDTVEPNAPLFSLRLVSETLHTSQLELFKATKEIEIAESQKKRLEGLAGIPGSRIIDIDNQIQRMDVNVQAYRQELLARGLPLEQIEAASRGEFVTEITVHAPGAKALEVTGIVLASAVEAEPGQLSFSFELQQLKVELGQQVSAGEVLCYLADHRAPLIEGHAFKKDMSLIQRAAREHLPVEVKFDVDEGEHWPALPKELFIHHVANLINLEDRTFSFYLPLENQWQSYDQAGKTRLIWRFRPGDRVRLFVTVDELENVIVLPQEAVVREGPEAYVFRQNGDLFDRLPVHVLHEDRDSVVIANDGSLRKGSFIAQNSAASLNRVLKAQMASGQPTNIHVHADGTTHAAH